MTLSEPIPQMNEQDTYPDVFEIPRQDAQYFISTSVGENGNPQVVRKAHQIHGISYVDYDYFDESGKTKDGSLVEDLDGTRGDPTGKRIANYLVASKVGESIEQAGATVRLLDIGDGGTIQDLPTYKYFADTLDNGIKVGLGTILNVYGKKSIREIAALGTVEDGDHRGSFELMRALVQNSMMKEEAGHPELYLASLTDNSFRPVLNFIHPKSASILSKPVQIFSEDPRSKLIYVTPVLMDLNAVLQNTMHSLENSRTPAEAARYEKSYRFITDGLPTSLIDKYVNDYNAKIVS